MKTAKPRGGVFPLRVLYAEDDPNMQMVIRCVLERADYLQHGSGARSQ
jgi:hypothetical protein